LSESVQGIENKRIIYLGSKKCKLVGTPGKESWQTNNGVSNLAFRSSSAIIFPRSAYNSGKISNSDSAHEEWVGREGMKRETTPIDKTTLF